MKVQTVGWLFKGWTVANWPGNSLLQKLIPWIYASESGEGLLGLLRKERRKPLCAAIDHHVKDARLYSA